MVWITHNPVIAATEVPSAGSSPPICHGLTAYQVFSDSPVPNPVTSEGDDILLQKGEWARTPEVYQIVPKFQSCGLMSGNKNLSSYAIISWYSGGGSGTFFSLLIRQGKEGTIQEFPLGDRVVIKSLVCNPSQGSFSLVWMRHGDDQARGAVPNTKVQRTFRMVGKVIHQK